jgi:hypothetical protein
MGNQYLRAVLVEHPDMHADMKLKTMDLKCQGTSRLVLKDTHCMGKQYLRAVLAHMKLKTMDLKCQGTSRLVLKDTHHMYIYLHRV